MLEFVYFAVSLMGLGGLAKVLVVIGDAAAACPQTAAAARLGKWVVTTGFVTLGAGAVSLIAAALPALTANGFSGLYAATGLMFLALGAGFYIAATMLNNILTAARSRIDADPAPA
ncbi:MAG: hypothetical protein AAF899_06560 [Pseudomonadota bacterium]